MPARGRRMAGATVRHGQSLAHVGSLEEAASLMALLGQITACRSPSTALAQDQLGAHAQELLGLAAEATATLGGPTVARGLSALRRQGRALPSDL
eukprot:2486205-Lingulodinium_polyedra.AAC.1